MKVSEIRELSNDSIILKIFYMGIVMSGGKQLKKDDEELLRYFKELERRGIIESAEDCAERSKK